MSHHFADAVAQMLHVTKHPERRNTGSAASRLAQAQVHATLVVAEELAALREALVPRSVVPAEQPRERDAVAGVDMRHGGSWRYQWDGSWLLVEPSHPLDPDGHTRIARRLAEVLDHLPAVPDGWDGWYYRRTGAREGLT